MTTATSKLPVRRDGSKVWIEGVKGFNTDEYCSSVHGCQARILQALGDSLTYDDLVCYSGFAFRVGLHDQMCPSAGHPCCGYMCIEGSNRAIPWQMDIYESGPWNKQPPADRPAFEARVRDAVRKSIDRGIPVHYGSEEDGLIIGYADDGKRWLCVHPYYKFGAETFWYDQADGFAGGKWPWAVVVWTQPKPAADRTSDSELLTAALKQAVDMWKTPKVQAYFCGDAAYENWLKWLQDVDSGKIKDYKGGMQGNGWCLDVLVQNRRIAGRWLKAKAATLDPNAAKQLSIAADHYTAIAEIFTKDNKRTWDLTLCPDKADSWTTALRQEEIRRLTEARAHDRAAITAIEQALAAMKTERK